MTTKFDPNNAQNAIEVRAPFKRVYDYGIQPCESRSKSSALYIRVFAIGRIHVLHRFAVKAVEHAQVRTRLQAIFGDQRQVLTSPTDLLESPREGPSPQSKAHKVSLCVHIAGVWCDCWAQQAR